MARSIFNDPSNKPVPTCSCTGCAVLRRGKQLEDALIAILRARAEMAQAIEVAIELVADVDTSE
jgi:hypothetical protein